MDSALIVSPSEKNLPFFSEMLRAAAIPHSVTTNTCGKARRMLLERDFDLVIINAPLRDETGESLARDLVGSGMQVILLVKSESFDQISAMTEAYGILTVAKPTSKALFWTALRLAKAVAAQLGVMKSENRKLQQKIEDVRIIDRAKCMLISRLCMSEHEAHRYIEKQAMDMRTAKRTVAEGILKTYEY